MADVRIGGIYADFRARNSQFLTAARRNVSALGAQRQALARMRQSMRQFNAASAVMIRRTRGLAIGLAALAAGGGVLGAVTRRSAQAGASLFELGRALEGADFRAGEADAERFNRSLQTLRAALEGNGLAADQFTKVLRRVIVAQGEAGRGLATYARAFEDAGIAARDLSRDGENSVDFFIRVAEGIGRISDRGRQAATAYNLFGRNFQQVLTTIRSGDLRAQVANFEQFETVTIAEAAALKALEQSYADFSRQVDVATQRTVAAFSGDLRRLLDSYVEALPALRQGAADVIGFVRANLQGLTNVATLAAAAYLGVGAAARAAGRVVLEALRAAALAAGRTLGAALVAAAATARAAFGSLAASATLAARATMLVGATFRATAAVVTTTVAVMARAVAGLARLFAPLLIGLAAVEAVVRSVQLVVEFSSELNALGGSLRALAAGVLAETAQTIDSAVRLLVVSVSAALGTATAVIAAAAGDLGRRLGEAYTRAVRGANPLEAFAGYGEGIARAWGSAIAESEEEITRLSAATGTRDAILRALGVSPEQAQASARVAGEAASRAARTTIDSFLTTYQLAYNAMTGQLPSLPPTSIAAPVEGTLPDVGDLGEIPEIAGAAAAAVSRYQQSVDSLIASLREDAAAAAERLSLLRRTAGVSEASRAAIEVEARGLGRIARLRQSLATQLRQALATQAALAARRAEAPEAFSVADSNALDAAETQIEEIEAALASLGARLGELTASVGRQAAAASADVLERALRTAGDGIDEFIERVDQRVRSGRRDANVGARIEALPPVERPGARVVEQIQNELLRERERLTQSLAATTAGADAAALARAQEIVDRYDREAARILASARALGVLITQRRRETAAAEEARRASEEALEAGRRAVDETQVRLAASARETRRGARRQLALSFVPEAQRPGAEFVAQTEINLLERRASLVRELGAALAAQDAMRAEAARAELDRFDALAVAARRQAAAVGEELNAVQAVLVARREQQQVQARIAQSIREATDAARAAPGQFARRAAGAAAESDFQVEQAGRPAVERQGAAFVHQTETMLAQQRLDLERQLTEARTAGNAAQRAQADAALASFDRQRAAIVANAQATGLQITANNMVLDTLRRQEQLAGNIGNAFGAFFNAAIVDFENIEQAALNFAQALAQALIQALLIQPVVAAIKSSLGGAGGIGGFFSGLFNFADGGLARGPAIVGERGPELVDFRTPARVYSNRDSRALLAGAGGPSTVIINYNIQSTDGPGVRRALAEATPGIVEQAEANVVRNLGRPSRSRDAAGR